MGINAVNKNNNTSAPPAALSTANQRNGSLSLGQLFTKSIIDSAKALTSQGGSFKVSVSAPSFSKKA